MSSQNNTRRIIIAGIITGILLGVFDGLLYGNPWARDMMSCYLPIARESVNAPLGMVADLAYGLIISWLFVRLTPVLPKSSLWLRGLCFGFGIWFLRVGMAMVSQWFMFRIPGSTLIYLLLTGMVEMLLLGLLNAVIFKKQTSLPL